MKDFGEFMTALVNRRDLSPEDARNAMHFIMSGNATDAQIAGFLVALRMKGETPKEIASMVKVMREFAEKIKPKVKGTLVDTCGTGGDALNTFNVSTVAMFVVAGAGVPVAKHGNRSVSSKCGSADVLEELGVKIDLQSMQVEKCIEEVGLGFMFAPIFHRAMRHVMPARRQLGVRTVFNILGPLTNPAGAQGQVVGVYNKNLTEKVAKVLKLVGVKRAFVVYGLDGLDEFSTVGRTQVAELNKSRVRTYEVKPGDYGLKKARPGDLSGGDAKFNAVLTRKILNGSETGARRDIVLLNAAAGLVVAGKAKSVKQGLELARKSIDSGSALEKLNDLIKYTTN